MELSVAVIYRWQWIGWGHWLLIWGKEVIGKRSGCSNVEIFFLKALNFDLIPVGHLSFSC